MPSTPHLEQHFTSSDVIRDIVIGMSDGLTVPFALAGCVRKVMQQIVPEPPSANPAVADN